MNELKRLCAAALLLCLAAWTVPQATLAADGIFDNPSQAFSWYSKGPGVMHLKLATTNGSPYRTLHTATYSLRDANNEEIPIIYIAEYSSAGSGSVTSDYANLQPDNTLLYLTNDTKWKPNCLISGNPVQRHDATRTGKEDGFAELDWYYPPSFAGKSFTLYVSATLWRDGGKTEPYERKLGTIDFDEMMFEVYDPIPGTELEDAGVLTLPVVCDRAINTLTTKYKNADGLWTTVNTPVQKSGYQFFVRIPATEVHDSLSVTINVTSATIEKSNLPDASWPSELRGDVTKEVGTVGMVHAPKFLRAEMDSVGAVVLQWQVTDPKVDDVFAGDMFDVQRSMTGNEKDFVSIGELTYDEGSTDYSFRDSTLVDSLRADIIDAKLGIPLVRYRVVRIATQQIWGIDKNPTVAYVQPQLNTLSLLRPKDAMAEWTDTLDRKIQVTWDYEKNADDVTYVWDNRAEMRVVTQLYNRDGQRVDSLTRVLTAAEINARKIEMTLTRSCVRYDLSIIVDSKKSPIGKGEANLFALLNSSDDYYTYARRRYEGLPHAPNIIMGNDFNILPRYFNDLIGSDMNTAFEGNFNGNGHTLKVEFMPAAEDNEQYIAPFRFAGNGAVICNLTTTGSFRAKKQFAAGLVGTMSTGKLFIENCVSNMTINSEVNGDGTHGGMVALIDLNSGTDNTKCLRISNSMVGCEFKGTSTNSWGGFVGWRRKGTFGMISNSYFKLSNPNDITSRMAQSSHTFMRNWGYDPEWSIVQDCLYDRGFNLEQGKQSSTPPDNGCWKDGLPAVKQMKFSTPTADNIAAVSTPADKFYFKGTGRVDSLSLAASTLQSSVMLTWSKTDGAIDFFEVERRNVTKKEPFEVIASGIVDMMYEDKTVSPIYDYEYRVSSNNDCEGKEVSYTRVVAGNCVKTGKVEGYVRFADGTGIMGVTVTASQKGSGANASKGGKCTTDESGYFCIEELPYWGNQQGAYQLTLSGVSSDDLDPNCRTGIGVTFDQESNYEKGCVFTVINSTKFSGLVMYKGTSIPVHGARFLVDNHEVRSAEGPVESDFEGKFSFRMLKKDHTIQVVMDGHDFYKGGYYYRNNSTNVTFDVDVANVYFYDETRVTLIGRVAGGKDQGDLPLNNSLSTNNLGDKLKMVLTLEGDNASWLVFDNVNRGITERDTTYIHPKFSTLDKNVYGTRVHTTRHRMEVWPDSLTGEYMVELPPVKWKIQQITAEGYATLFQEGKTSDVIDLTDSLKLHTDHLTGNWRSRMGEDVNSVEVKYHAKYSRIYRSPVLLERRQVGFDKFDYFGEKSYTMRPLVGGNVVIPVAYPVTTTDPKTGKDITTTKYSFNYPVFSTDRGYAIKLSAVERYYYNNNVQSDTVDVVKLDGGFITVRNGFISSTQRDTLSLDSNGEGTYVLRAAQRPYLLTGKDALCTVTFTMERDGVTFEGEPLKGYTFSQYAKQGAKDILSINQPVLVDILRDPPGGGSSAKLSKGSTLKLAYQMDMAWKAGLTLGISTGSGMNHYTGIGGIGFEAGVINGVSSLFNTSFDLIFSGSGQRAFSYTMTANEDISTDASATMVGANADLYIGMETNMFLRPAVAIRAINDSVYQANGGARNAGYMVEIARGYDENGKKIYLVRDEVIGYGQTVKSTFVHSQQYILKQLIPDLANQCKALMFFGTEEEAKNQANATKQPVYWSLRDVGDDDFGVMNTVKDVTLGDDTWTYVYNTTVKEKQEGINYCIILPEGYQGAQVDKVKDFCEAMYTWASMIARNEKEKLEATNKMKNIEMDGGGSVSYSEDFAAEYSNTTSYNWIGSDFTHNYFANPDPDNPDAYGDKERTAAAFSSMAGILGPTVAKMLFSLLNNSKGMSAGGSEATVKEKFSPLTELEVSFVGIKWKFNLTPTLAFGVTPKNSESRKYNRKESFTIKMDKKSHMDFDVYYATPLDSRDDTSVDSKTDIFVEENFLNSVDYVEYFLDRDVGSNDIVHDMVKPRGFIYRTRGGATCRPWEDERKTIFYRHGTVLDERTKKIENPVIKMDKQSVSGVPIDQPARFKLYLTNDSEEPEAVYNYFNILMNERSNPKGARLMLDGMPLSGNARTLEVRPGVVTEKTLEVWAGEDFDYEDLKITLMSVNDLDVFTEASFSVHFLRTAGSVEIATPGDKWIMNTDAPFDEKRGWYLPVIISGFNKNQHNFDHIELQYKESTRGDDYWTNLCAFYADSVLYNAASGTHEMIPENGNIVTRFYGDGTVMEKAYDLRARLYCRNGNSFITSDSKVLSGIKDTRRPQLFGSPDPRDGIIGPGDNIVFNFSEAIEHNYLQQATNFEVVGETNETALSEEPSLLFTGTGYAETDARRNFASKSVTIDLMVRPDSTGRDMPLFSHGIDGHSLQLWLTSTWRLRGVIDNMSFDSEKTVKKGSLQHVALIIDNEHKQALLYNDSIIGTLDNVAYSGYGPLIFGATNEVDVDDRIHYRGRMLEARIWTRTMTEALLNTYGKRQLTGYEMGLADYYPMNEGESTFAIDKAQGANAELHGADWALPRGMSLSLDWDEQKPVKGLHLRSKLMERSAEDDYTLMFWFKTNERGKGALVSNGSGRKTDADAKNKFYIGFEGEQLKYRTNGNEVLLGKDYADDEWHHFALTVDRAHKLANIWVDRTLQATMPTDTLGGMEGDDFYVGNMVWHEAGANVLTEHSQNALTGHIDELCLFSQALPPSLIKRYSTKSPSGKEKGMLLYMGFCRQERNEFNELELRPYAYSQRVYFDMDGKATDERDSVFVEPVSVVMQHIDASFGAPVQANKELRNLNFSFVGRDNQLLVNIDETDARINKRNLYVTVTDIPDLNGNYMASPATAEFFVDRNPLRWERKSWNEEIWTSSYAYDFDVKISNTSGAVHEYTVDNLPRWLTVNRQTDVIDPKAEHTLRFTVNSGLNVGTYDEIIYLTDENGLSEPLALTIRKEGDYPEWYVNDDMKHYSMNVVGQVKIGSAIVTDPEDIVAAFDARGRCMGMTNVNYDPNTAQSQVFMTVFDSTSVYTNELTFKLWHHQTGQIMMLKTDRPVKFVPGSVEGSVDNPVMMTAGSLYYQQLNLLRGWNWISFNVDNDAFFNPVELLKHFEWNNGDILTDDTDDFTFIYNAELGKWLANKDNGKDMVLSNKRSYRVYLHDYLSVEIPGYPLKSLGQRTIPVKHGWNNIGYTPVINLPVSTAMADYAGIARNRDVVKSRSAFAVYTETSAGNGYWSGSLEYMVPGEGYMLYRNAEDNASFHYPYAESGTSYFEGTVLMARDNRAYASTMSLAADVVGIELHEGDRLLAFSEGELRGEALAVDSVFYVSIEGDKKAPLSFAIEREGEIIATTAEVMMFEKNTISGSPMEPTAISFVRADLTQQGWYTVDGVKLQGKPQRKGVYIYNGKKKVIR